MKHKKISGALLAAFEDLKNEGPVALTSHSRTLSMAPVLGTQKPPRAIVFIHCDESANFVATAVPTGTHVNQKKGRVRTAIVELSKIGDLSELPKVKRIVGSRKLRPLLDKALAKTKVIPFQNSTGLSGKNVVVGVVDTGIDPNHADFAGRILSIWDQTIAGPGVQEGGYGLELNGAAMVASRDTHGHGTHVAGIAAGNGTTYRGVANEAELVIVKTTFEDAHIADAIRYVFRVAQGLGRPAVVNLSLGGHFDAHDGTDSLSQIINDEVGPGRIVCAAAGNEGSDAIHARVKLGAPATKKVKFSIPGGQVRRTYLNGWYPGSGKLEVSITSPTGQSTPFQPVIATGNFQKRYTLGDARITIQTPSADIDNGDHNFNVEIRPKSSDDEIPSGTWELRVKNLAMISGKLDVWSLDDQESPTVIFRDIFESDSHKIGSPGCSNEAITVGAFVTRNDWTDIVGDQQTVDLDLNDMADFSSEGPLRNEAKKPDLSAPGAMIVSCLSVDSGPERWTIVDTGHVNMQGTSMACSFVTGVVALLLERDPTMTPAAVKAALKAACRIPSKPAGTFDKKWGYGLVDVKKLT
jgi:subtilisin family serine protease